MARKKIIAGRPEPRSAGQPAPTMSAAEIEAQRALLYQAALDSAGQPDFEEKIAALDNFESALTGEEREGRFIATGVDVEEIEIDGDALYLDLLRLAEGGQTQEYEELAKAWSSTLDHDPEMSFRDGEGYIRPRCPAPSIELEDAE